jgi:HlyD family secretion protein
MDNKTLDNKSLGSKNFLKDSNRMIIALSVVGAGLCGATVLYSLSKTGQKPAPVAVTPAVPIAREITALGRIQPRSEIVTIAAPMLLDSDRVAKLLVDEGDSVKAGQTIAVLESRDRLENNLVQAIEQVKVAEAKLEQVRAGAKQGEIEANAANAREVQARWFGDRETQRVTIQRLEAQVTGDTAAARATIARLDAEYRNAEAEYARNKQLYEEGAISASAFDAKRLSVETSRQQLNEARVTLDRIRRTGSQQIREAKASLDRIESTGRQQVSQALSTLAQVAEVREVDVRAAAAEVNAARAAVKKATTELQQAYIRSPISGRVVKVHTRVGEQIGDNGLLELAETDRMEVVAEVYQSDIRDVRVGQTASITGSAFAGEALGRVRLIGLQVDKQNIFSGEPGENFDRKVIPVQIALTPESGRKVAGLTNSQVTVSIAKSGTGKPSPTELEPRE